MTKQESFTREEILKSGGGELFEAPFPRLPVPNMLMFDRIASVTEDGGSYGKGQIVAELDIDPDLWFFKCHFVDDPVMPGCLGLDAMWQLIGFFLAWKGHKGKGRALGVKEVKFSGQILPSSEIVSYEIDIKRVIASRLVVGVADAAVSVDGRRVYAATGLKVGLFTSTDGF